MSFLAAIEITCLNDGLPIRTIEEGYQFSRSGTVLFIMNGVTARQINLALDRIVPTLPLTIPGVLYVNIADDEQTRGAFEVVPVICPASGLCRHIAIASGHQRKLMDYADFARLMLMPETPMSDSWKLPAGVISGTEKIDAGRAPKLWPAPLAPSGTRSQYPSDDRAR
jgi:hypothetical protein